jgi:hypothetical protein
MMGRYKVRRLDADTYVYWKRDTQNGTSRKCSVPLPANEVVGEHGTLETANKHAAKCKRMRPGVRYQVEQA